MARRRPRSSSPSNPSFLAACRGRQGRAIPSQKNQLDTRTGHTAPECEQCSRTRCVEGPGEVLVAIQHNIKCEEHVQSHGRCHAHTSMRLDTCDNCRSSLAASIDALSSSLRLPPCPPARTCEELPRDSILQSGAIGAAVPAAWSCHWGCDVQTSAMAEELQTSAMAEELAGNRYCTGEGGV